MEAMFGPSTTRCMPDRMRTIDSLITRSLIYFLDKRSNEYRELQAS